MGCPSCGGHRLTATNSLAAVYPAIARQWHPTKNGKLTPRDLRWGSSKGKVWWRCTKDPSHAWMATVVKRTSGGQGCSICAGKTVTAETSLAAVYPSVAREWHPTKNRPLSPEAVAPVSSRRIWWRCVRGRDHVWCTTIATRTLNGANCPVCAGQKATRTTALRAKHPELAREWHPTKNGALTAGDVTPGSGKRVWWRCSVDPRHEWQTTIIQRTSRGSGCSACRGRDPNPPRLADACPELARQWHPTKNGPLTPADVSFGSGRKVWWRCALNPHHEWESEVKSRTRARAGCPWCRASERRAKRPRRTAARVPLLI